MSSRVSRRITLIAAALMVAAPSSAFATVSGSGLTNNLDTVLALMADVLMHPSFQQAEIDRYKARQRGRTTGAESEG